MFPVDLLGADTCRLLCYGKISTRSFRLESSFVPVSWTCDLPWDMQTKSNLLLHSGLRIPVAISIYLQWQISNIILHSCHRWVDRVKLIKKCTRRYHWISMQTLALHLPVSFLHSHSGCTHALPTLPWDTHRMLWRVTKSTKAIGVSV
jgi:hypothetical protein